MQIVNNTLYVSVDSKGGSGSARSYIGTLGNAGTPPTSTVGAPVMLSGFGNNGGTGKVTITSGSPNTGNGLNAGLQINLSPSNYFFANPATLYVADTGNAKNNSANSTLGDGGLQKWVNSNANGTGTWSLAYTLYKGLNLVANTTGTGTSGLYGLTGTISSGAVQLFATNATLSDLDPTLPLRHHRHPQLHHPRSGRQRDLFPARHRALRLQLQGRLLRPHRRHPGLARHHLERSRCHHLRQRPLVRAA